MRPAAPQFVEPLVAVLRSSDATLPAASETSYGLLQPPLGRCRLKVVELLAALLRAGDDAAPEAALSAGGALPLCLQLFQQFPFNNLLHFQARVRGRRPVRVALQQQRTVTAGLGHLAVLSRAWSPLPQSHGLSWTHVPFHRLGYPGNTAYRPLAPPRHTHRSPT